MKFNFKEFIEPIYKKRRLPLRLVIVNFSVIMMGFCLSWLIPTNFGTDPCTFFNLRMSELLGLSIGNFQAILNSLMFIAVFIWGREMIGFGTVANMFLVGYSIDFFSWLWKKILPADFFEPFYVRVIVLILGVLVFVIAAAFYMDIQLGTSPYDSIGFMITKALRNTKISPTIIRIAYDSFYIVMAVIAGATLQPVTIMMALLLGPAITQVAKLIDKLNLGDIDHNKQN